MYGEPGILFNLSVWESVETLFTYTYRGPHAKMMQSRRDWFGEMDGPNYALWWLPSDQLPTLEEGKNRIRHLAENGPTEYAFTFKQSFLNPGMTPMKEDEGVIMLQPFQDCAQSPHH